MQVKSSTVKTIIIIFAETVPYPTEDIPPSSLLQVRRAFKVFRDSPSRLTVKVDQSSRILNTSHTGQLDKSLQAIIAATKVAAHKITFRMEIACDSHRCEFYILSRTKLA